MGAERGARRPGDRAPATPASSRHWATALAGPSPPERRLARTRALQRTLGEKGSGVPRCGHWGATLPPVQHSFKAVPGQG